MGPQVFSLFTPDKCSQHTHTQAKGQRHWKTAKDIYATDMHVTEEVRDYKTRRTANARDGDWKYSLIHLIFASCGLCAANWCVTGLLFNLYTVKKKKCAQAHIHKTFGFWKAGSQTVHWWRLQDNQYEWEHKAHYESGVSTCTIHKWGLCTV